MIQATGDIATQWILDLCNGIVKEGCIPEDLKSSVVLPIYRGKGDPMESRSYGGIRLLEHATKVVERPRVRPKKTWREIVQKDCQTHILNREDALDHNRWTKQISDD